MEEKDASSNIEVLREMAALGEKRRSEELKWIEKLNQYNLALIAFSGSFVFFLITSDQDHITVKICGLFAIGAIVLSLIAIFPRKMKGSAPIIEDDIKTIRNGNTITIRNFLLETADVYERSATAVAHFSKIRKNWTIASAGSLAFAIILSYIFYVCQK